MKKKKITNYVKKRIAAIKASQRKKRPRAKRKKCVDIILKTKGFYLDMALCPSDEIDMLILNEANKLMLRRAV